MHFPVRVLYVSKEFLQISAVHVQSCLLRFSGDLTAINGCYIVAAQDERACLQLSPSHPGPHHTSVPLACPCRKFNVRPLV